MKEEIKVRRLSKEIDALGKKIKTLRPSRHKDGLMRYQWMMANSIKRLQGGGHVEQV